MKSNRSKACDIPQKIKKRVWERDGGRCIICGSRNALPSAHYISRAQGGLGIEENIVTLCFNCHREYDNTDKRSGFRKYIEKYLRTIYKDWSEEKLYFRR